MLLSQTRTRLKWITVAKLSPGEAATRKIGARKSRKCRKTISKTSRAAAKVQTRRNLRDAARKRQLIIADGASKIPPAKSVRATSVHVARFNRRTRKGCDNRAPGSSFERGTVSTLADTCRCVCF